METVRTVFFFLPAPPAPPPSFKVALVGRRQKKKTLPPGLFIDRAGQKKQGECAETRLKLKGKRLAVKPSQISFRRVLPFAFEVQRACTRRDLISWTLAAKNHNFDNFYDILGTIGQFGRRAIDDMAASYRHLVRFLSKSRF